MISQFIPDDETECMDPPLQFLSKTGWGIWKTVSRSCNLWHCSQSESVHAVFQLHLNKIHVAERKHNLKSIFQGTFPFLDNAYIDFILILLLLKYYQNENIFIIGPTPFLHPVEGKAPSCLNIFLEKGFKMIYMW